MAEGNNDLESVLQCTICLDLFTNPHILKCLHTLCKECVDQLIESSPSKSIALCPECRQTSNKSEIKKDFNKQTLLDIYHNTRNKPHPKQIDNVQKINTVNTCEICSSGVISGGCMECVKLMCDICKSTHHSIPACKTHIIHDIDSIMKPFKNQLQMAVGAINQVGKQLATKQTEMMGHAQKIYHAQNSVLKQINDTEKAMIEQTRNYFKSLKSKAESKYENELHGTQATSNHIKKGLDSLEKRHREVEAVLHGNDYRKIVYHTKGACKTINGEISKMQTDLSKIHLNQIPMHFVRCDRIPEINRFVTENIYQEASNESVFYFQANKNPSAQVNKASPAVKQRDVAKARLSHKLNRVLPKPKDDRQAAASKLPDSSSLPYENIDLSYFCEGDFVLDKNVVVHSTLDQYFKIKVIDKELWCTLSDRIEIYDCDGEYMRTLSIEEIGNPYAVINLPETSSMYLSSVNGLFQLNSDDQITNVISKEKFTDITITQGKFKAICAIDMWKQRAVAFSYQKNEWCKAGEIPLQGEINDLHDTVVSTLDFFWIGSYGKSMIYKHTIRGELVNKFNVNKPHVCTADSNGLVLCVDESKKYITILDSTGNLTSIRLEKKDLSPVYCSVDHEGALWVLSNERPFKLLKFVKCVALDSSDSETLLSNEERDKLLQAL